MHRQSFDISGTILQRMIASADVTVQQMNVSRYRYHYGKLRKWTWCMTCHKLRPFCRKDAFHRLRQKT
jgi:hypothetical protein